MTGRRPVKPGRRGKRLPATASSTLRLTQWKRPTKQMMRFILQKLLPLRSPGSDLRRSVRGVGRKQS